ncbi:MAG TPA: hypothetical protein VFG39_04895, partial [Balneolaceae bacterium]|nr:hypothetical protein [Balneolaceae bacterium]
SGLYPSWYGQQTVVSADSVIYAYATAIDDDSAAAVSKAVAWAESELSSSISYSLEKIRNDALAALGSESGLGEPAFIFALRKVDRVVNDMVSTTNTAVKTVEGYESYRSFAEVKVAKAALIESIAAELEGHEETWNTLVESQAFLDF